MCKQDAVHYHMLSSAGFEPNCCYLSKKQRSKKCDIIDILKEIGIKFLKNFRDVLAHSLMGTADEPVNKWKAGTARAGFAG